MKKILLTSVFAFFLAAASLFAGNADMFSYDREDLNNQMAELNSLESYVRSNEGLTLTNLIAENNPLVAGINVSNPFASAFLSEVPLGIPSFWWGCCIGVWGIAVVYFVTEDKEEVKKAIKGCVVGTLVGVVLYVGVYIWVLGNAAYWSY